MPHETEGFQRMMGKVQMILKSNTAVSRLPQSAQPAISVVASLCSS